MRIGDLVRIKRASIGIPMDTLGLLIEKKKTYDRYPDEGYNREELEAIWDILLLGLGVLRLSRARRLSRDLEVVT